MSTSHLVYMEDSTRLPPGFERIAYDADRQVYTYRDASGDLWEGEPGNVYGRLHPVADVPLVFSMPWHPSNQASPSFCSCHHALSSPLRHGSCSSSSVCSRHGSFSSSSICSPHDSMSSSSSPMTNFPPIWDPPASYETDDLPSAKRFKAQVAMVSKNVFRPHQQRSETSRRYKSRGGSVMERAALFVQRPRRRRGTEGAIMEQPGEGEPRSVFEW